MGSVDSVGLRERPANTMLATFIAMNGYRDYAVGWFTLALINAGLAQGKKRSGALWFIVSLFLGPIATFVIVITDSEA